MVNNKTILPNKSQGRVIEFIGPSGVGKTTLYQLSRNKMSCLWNDLEHLNHYELGNTPKEIINLHWEILKHKIMVIIVC